MASSLICVCGSSNAGKSTSLKYLNPKETFIVSCTNKQLQIPGAKKKYQKARVENGNLVGNWFVSNNYENINKIVNIVSTKRADIKTVVLDDINYLLSAETFSTALNKG